MHRRLPIVEIDRQERVGLSGVAAERCCQVHGVKQFGCEASPLLAAIRTVSVTVWSIVGESSR